MIQECLRLHNTQLLHADREEEQFFKICSSWNSRLYAVWNGGHMAEYLCARGEEIYEMVLEEEELLFSCLETYFEQFACHGPPAVFSGGIFSRGTSSGCFGI